MNAIVRTAALTAVFFGLLLCGNARAQDTQHAALRDYVAEQLPSIVEVYKHLHTNPELSGTEGNTAKRLAAELRAAGFEVTEAVGGTGIVAVLKNGDGPTVLVRSDMDALPISEDTGADYASSVRVPGSSGTEVGVMHACGHDIHMSNLIGTARALSKFKDQWVGTVVLVGQPAEEIAAGAKAMLADGLYERFPRPNYCLALHVDAGLPAGEVGFIEGAFNAAVNSVDIVVYGVGGHGAYPHNTIDPVVTAAQIVLALQTIVSRETDPTDAAVVTVGVIKGGSKRNVIPDEVRLELTVRTRKPEVRARVLTSIQRIAEHTARAAGVPEDKLPKVEVLADQQTPVTYNDPSLVQRSVGAMRSALGNQNVVGREATMGGEDFGFYGEVDPAIPVFMYRLGSVSPVDWARFVQGGEALPGLHSAKYLPDPERTIRTGVVSMTSAVMELLKPK